MFKNFVYLNLCFCFDAWYYTFNLLTIGCIGPVKLIFDRKIVIIFLPIYKNMFVDWENTKFQGQKQNFI